MEQRDAADVAHLAAQLGYAASAVEVSRRVGELLCTEEHLLLVATDASGVVIGWLHALIGRRIEIPPFVQIAALIVEASRRSQGVGAVLVEAAEEWARSKQIVVVKLSSNVARARAHGFYQRLGYRNASSSQWFTKSLLEIAAPDTSERT